MANTGLVDLYGKPVSPESLGISGFSPLTNAATQGAYQGADFGAGVANYPKYYPSITGSPPPSGGGSPGVSGNNVAQSAFDAELASANTAYDYTRSQLENQLSSLGTQKQNTLAEIGQTLSRAGTNVASQKAEQSQMGEEQIGEAGATAKNTQRSNRNVLRALGILNSSYASDKLMEPMNQFDVQRAKIGQQVMTNYQKLNDFYNQQLESHRLAVKSVEDQYTGLVNNIQTDLRFNERERLDAVKQANAALQQRLYEIAQSFTSNQNTVKTQQQNLALQLTQMQLANPDANLSGILGSNMATAGNFLSGNTSQTAAISPYLPDGTLRKQTLSGFGQ